jgi:hypothetical protein
MHRSDGIHGADTSSPSDSLPALVGRLGEDLSRLVDSKLGLLKIEIQDDLHSYLRGAVYVVAAGAVAAVGFGLVSVGVALFAATLLAQSASLSWPTAQAAGFAVIGLSFLVGGVIVARLAIARLKDTDLTPGRSIRELERDRKWLRADR